MTEPYIVTSTGIKDGKPYSTLQRIVQGVKASGDKYCFIDTKSPEKHEQEMMTFGGIFEYQSTLIKSNKA